ncbi:Uncharacterised protein [Mycobacteroides abscessus subsp. abscessus]|nr:Uncharacterised protein [Mycobacteroides abscessus subsp. abscessus]
MIGAQALGVPKQQRQDLGMTSRQPVCAFAVHSV